MMPSWDEIGKLGAIVVLRTVLNYFLEREIEQEQKKAKYVLESAARILLVGTDASISGCFRHYRFRPGGPGHFKPRPRRFASEIAGGRRRDRRTRRDDTSNTVAYNRASHLAPDPDIHANPLPAHPAEEGVRVGEAPAF